MRATRHIVVLALLLVACGEGPKATPAAAGSAGQAASGVEITGTIAPRTPEVGKLLVFAYANAGPDVSPASLEPASVSAIGADRSFMLTSVPPGRVTILVLADRGSDGAIDPGDPIAILDDPDAKLAALQGGDAVVIRDLAFDAQKPKAIAAGIDVRRAAAPAPAQGQ